MEMWISLLAEKRGPFPPPGLGFSDLGFRIWDFGFGVSDLGFRGSGVSNLGFRGSGV